MIEMQYKTSPPSLPRARGEVKGWGLDMAITTLQIFKKQYIYYDLQIILDGN